jgi:hypothetical protein
VQPLHVCTPKGIRNDGIQIAGHLFLSNVVCEKQVVCGPLRQTLVGHELAEAPMRKMFCVP